MSTYGLKASMKHGLLARSQSAASKLISGSLVGFALTNASDRRNKVSFPIVKVNSNKLNLLTLGIEGLALMCEWKIKIGENII